MQVHYLEIVTHEVEATCATYGSLHPVTFGDPDPALGNARTAALSGGGLIGVRAPMHEAEEPIIRPYLLTADIDAAVERAVTAGAELLHPPMEIPGHGKFAIIFQGGNQHGFWEL